MIITNDAICIGIHIGATYSCIGIWMGNKVEIIVNSLGSRTTPSYIAFTDAEILIGEAAYNQLAMNPTNTVFDITRLIGRKFKEEIIQKHIKSLPFKVEEGPDGKPLIIVTYKGETKQFSPEELLAMLLGKLKEDAESFLDKPIKDVVIAVPAFCSDTQRVGIKDAANIAGLNVIRLIREPVAAALAYKLDENTEAQKNILIFSLGESSFELSLMTVEEEVFEIIAIGGRQLGGSDFDNKLIEFCVEDFKKKTGFDIRNNQRAMKRLKIHCERAKKALSSSTQAIIEVDVLYESIDYSCTMTRAKFEQLCSSLFSQIIPLVEQVLKDSHLAKEQVHNIVLIGGSSNIPKIVGLLSKYFDGKKLLNSINPDEVVACGATIQSAIFVNKYRPCLPLITDVVILSLGIETAGGLMTDILPRNTHIPAKKQRLFTTYMDNQSSVLIKIYEGQKTLTKDNHFVGKIELDGLPLGQRGINQIEVSFEIDNYYDVTVEAVEKKSGQSKKIIIPHNMKRLSVDSIVKMVIDAEDNRKENEMQKMKIEARNSLESCCYAVRIALNDERLQEKVSEFEKEKVENMCDNSIKWIKNNPDGEVEEMIKKKRELEEVFSQIDKAIQTNIAAIEYGVCIQNEVESYNKSTGPIVEEVD